MYDVVVIGGGIAGLIASIDLRQKGWTVLVIEKSTWPKHKVCGEYISNEVLPYLSALKISPFKWGAVPIKTLQFSAPDGFQLSANLPLGGFSISRKKIDHSLYQLAVKSGVEIWDKTEVDNVLQDSGNFAVQSAGKSVSCKLVLGAYGKRSKLDREWNRPFFQSKSHHVGIKQYYETSYPNDLVGLHNFKHGYLGISMVEDNLINVAMLVDSRELKNGMKPDLFLQKVIAQQPQIRKHLAHAKPVLEKPLAISNISFLPKSVVENNVLMLGDAAGMIPPLAGNGMAMGIEAARICCTLSHDFLEGNISFEHLCDQYRQSWKREFGKRLKWGRMIQRIMGKPALCSSLLRLLALVPRGLEKVVKKTHGNGK